MYLLYTVQISGVMHIVEIQLYSSILTITRLVAAALCV